MSLPFCLELITAILFLIFVDIIWTGTKSFPEKKIRKKLNKLKFTFSEKATKIEKIFSVNLTVCSNRQIDGEDFVNFCGLLRKYELYNVDLRDELLLLSLFDDSKNVNVWVSLFSKIIVINFCRLPWQF